MSAPISKDQIADFVGRQLPPSPWFKIDQSRINTFAEVTEDHQFIHVDPEAAARTPFGTTIAHGFLTLSLLSHLAESFALVLEGAQMGINYGFDKVRFINPVTVDSEIRAVATVVSIEEKNPGQWLTKYAVTVEIKGQEKPALSAEWLGMQIVQ
ncbi:MaoC family dehydratase [Exilibacterium tricleocarpae]|uniref:MaoC family dehydratase n=1 Tax=Exilibacterium tricleocarpae TaxID=2591008 RepID=A0A545U701_9GAMM|nr:MaoC family dehydratase [Exilibacterium tricleocarpae]TQV85259.1 MaoC family dehydratase [Exilibacterium tricleocarpae]